MLSKRIYLLAIAHLLCFGLYAQNLTPMDADSKISFVIKNMGMAVDGTLKDLKGKIFFDPKNMEKNIFDLTVDVNTINTDNNKRDEHLKKSDFFDASKFPVINLKTTKIQSKGNNVYFANAVLNMHGVSKTVQFDFIAKPIQAGYHFTGSFTVNRRDYNIGGSSMTMSDDVTVTLDVVARK